MRVHLFIKAISIGFFFCQSVSLFGQEKIDTLTNKSIIELKKINLSQSAIKLKINSSWCVFDLSVEGITALKKAGIPDEIIEEMLRAKNISVDKKNKAEDLNKKSIEPAKGENIKKSVFNLKENGYSKFVLNSKSYTTKYHQMLFGEQGFGTFHDEVARVQFNILTVFCPDSLCSTERAFNFTFFTGNKKFEGFYPVQVNMDAIKDSRIISAPLGFRKLKFEVVTLNQDKGEFIYSPVRKVNRGSVKILKYDIENRLISGEYDLDVVLFDRTPIKLKGVFSDISF